MYTLYFLPGACSLATQVVLRELKQPVKLIEHGSVEDFKEINPVGTVPVLLDGSRVLTEGAAIIFHLLEQHPNELIPNEESARLEAKQNILFANATMHPAYGKLFFISQNIADENVKKEAFAAATNTINHLWQVVESKLADKTYLGGDKPSPADILLAVYYRWGESFPVEIIIGPKTLEMVEAIYEMPSFKESLNAEAKQISS